MYMSDPALVEATPQCHTIHKHVISFLHETYSFYDQQCDLC